MTDNSAPRPVCPNPRPGRRRGGAGQRDRAATPRAPLTTARVRAPSKALATVGPVTELGGGVAVYRFASAPVRMIALGGEVYFVAADVCEVLGYSRVSNALRMLEDEDFTTHLVSSPDDGRVRPTPIVTEAGLYTLILRSKRKEAREFKRWVVGTVLPEIRRTGSFTGTMTRPPALPSPREWAEMVLAAEDRADAAGARAASAEAEVDELAPAASHWERLADAAGDYSVREAAQSLSRDPEIEIGQNQLFRKLRDLGWISRDGRPYQRMVRSGRMCSRLRTYQHPHTGDPATSVQPRLTAKGVEELHDLLRAHLAVGGRGHD